MRRPRTRTIVMGVLGLAVVVLAMGGSRTWMTWALCRTYRLEERFGPIRWAHDIPNDCSRWYASHVETQHDHLWQKSSCTKFWSLLGWGYACGKSSPIWSIPVETQLKYYRHLREPRTGRELFLKLSDRTFYEQRLDRDDYPSKGYIVADALNDWVFQGFPGTWEDWWARAWRLHEVEHAALLRWHAAKTDLSFADWRAAQPTGE